MKIISLITLTSILTFTSALCDSVNTACPVKGRPADGRIAVPVKIDFCCQKCLDKFEKDPVSFLSKVAKTAKGQCPVSGRKINKASTALISVAVCCNGCKGKVEAEPREYLARIGKSKRGS
ncbi:MAG: hypothetical protein DBX00_12375 [Verrucomicrobia bacterium]|nr:hypothetical protein [Roseibacillus sp.]RCL33158.1 MAG: hypothetical protein DBX00_12375 [Verrucomicrobiota bacterium]RPF85141.1 MAG: hypothetical protein CBB78_013135 [Roseibacillus sp. TMED18]